ncbi:MAG: transporter family protein, partial [Nevskia sp.]|nr:transporter family protein [Nevskia sp.]
MNTIHFGRRSLQLMLQSEVAECGLACLAMIATYHGFRTDLATLRGRFSVSLNGATFQTLIGYADRIKLSGRPLSLELDELRDLKTPCILHW